MSTEAYFDLVARFKGTGVDDFQQKIREARDDASKLERETSKAFSSVADSAGVAAKSIDDQTKEAQKQLGVIEKLEREYNDLGKKIKQAQNVDDIKAYRKEQEKVVKQLNEINETTKPIAQNGKDLETSFAGAGTSLSGMIPAVAAVGTATAVVKAGWDKVNETTEKVIEQLRIAEQLTGLQGDALESTRGRAAALAETFDKDFNEVLIAANSLSNGFGIGLEDAFTLIEDGFVKGADVSGDFLDSLREYPTQFENAGGSAEQFVALLTDAQEKGVFSDKGIDAVKEFNLRVREQASGTRDALIALLGEQEAETLFQGINDGSITTIDALKQVSTGLNDASVSTNVLQTAVADVFGGAGEDAGLAYLQSLQDIDTVTQNLSESTTELQERQREQLRLQEQLATAEGELAAAFGSTGEQLGNIGTELNILWVEFLTWLVTEIRETADAFNDFYDESLKPIVDFFVDLYDSGVALFKDLGEAIGISSEEGSQFFDIISKGFTSFSTTLKVGLASISATIDGIKLVAAITGDSFSFVADFIGASFDLTLNAIKGTLNQILGAASEVKEFLGGDAIKFRFETEPVEFPDFQGFLNEQGKSISDFNDKQKDRFIGLVKDVVGINKQLVDENQEVVKKLTVDTETEADKAADAVVEVAKRAKDEIKKIDPIGAETAETSIQIPVGFNVDDTPAGYSEEEIRERFETLRGEAEALGGALDDLLGVPGLDNLFGELSTFFAAELPEGVTRTQAALGAATAGIGILSSALTSFYGQQIEQNQALIDSIDERVAEQEEVISRELELQEEGKANSVRTAQEEKDALLRQKEEALAEQEKLQKRQAVIEALQQGSALATTAAQIFASQAPKGLVGVALAVSALATVLGTFSKFKRDAKSAIYAKKGHAEILGGSLHTSGGVPLEGEAERGEALAILNRKATGKYGKQFLNLVNDLNAGKELDVMPPPLEVRTAPLREAMNWQMEGGVQSVSPVESRLANIEKLLENWEHNIVYRDGDSIRTKKGNKITMRKVKAE